MVLTRVVEAAYHAGEDPDSRTMSTLEANGIADYEHAARRVSWAVLGMLTPKPTWCGLPRLTRGAATV